MVARPFSAISKVDTKCGTELLAGTDLPGYDYAMTPSNTWFLGPT